MKILLLILIFLIISSCDDNTRLKSIFKQNELIDNIDLIPDNCFTIKLYQKGRTSNQQLQYYLYRGVQTYGGQSSKIFRFQETSFQSKNHANVDLKIVEFPSTYKIKKVLKDDYNTVLIFKSKNLDSFRGIIMCWKNTSNQLIPNWEICNQTKIIKTNLPLKLLKKIYPRFNGRYESIKLESISLDFENIDPFEKDFYEMIELIESK